MQVAFHSSTDVLTGCSRTAGGIGARARAGGPAADAAGASAAGSSAAGSSAGSAGA